MKDIDDTIGNHFNFKNLLILDPIKTLKLIIKMQRQNSNKSGNRRTASYSKSQN